MGFGRLPQFSFITWAVILGMLLGRIGTSMTVPFITLFLTQKANVPSSTAGLVVGAVWVAYAVFGIVGGMISDKIGRKFILIVSLFLYSLTFLAYFFCGSFLITSPWIAVLYGLIGLLAGLSRSWSETIGQALISEHTPDSQKRSAFMYRYISANIGAAIGPALGAFFGLSGNLYAFLVSGFVFFLYSSLFWVVLHKIKFESETAPAMGLKIADMFRVLRQDHRLRYFVLALTVVNIGFSLHETLFAQVVYASTKDLGVYSRMLSLNALLVIVLQLPLANRFAQIHPLRMMTIGAMFTFGGLMAVGLAHVPWQFYLGEIILTGGEILVYPFCGVVVDSLARDDLKGSYFGATTLQNLGRALGPFVGGLLFQEFGAMVCMSVVSTIVLSSVVFFHAGMDRRHSNVQVS